MELRRRVTGALAWAGLVLIVAVPSAELVRSKLFAKSAMTVTSATAEAPAVVTPVKAKPKPVVVASAPVAPKPATKPVVQPAAPTSVVASTNPPVESDGDAVKDYLAANKKLPDYITGSTSAAPVAAVPAQQLPTALPAAAPTTVATASPAPIVNAPATIEPAPADPTAVATLDVQPVVPDVPPIPMPASARPKPQAVAQAVTEADLKDWKSGTLEDYLRAHGLLADGADHGDTSDVPPGGY
jgi:hypothetical protein